MNIKEVGIYIPDKENKCHLVKVDFNRVNKQIWLDTIQFVQHHEATGGMSIPIDVYDCIFNIAPGIGKGKVCTPEKHKLILRVWLTDWYMPKESVIRELKKAFEDYPIDGIHEVLQALLSRNNNKERRYIYE